MDGIQRHKRSFTEMSHSATLSPSPHNFGERAASIFFPPPRQQPQPSLDPQPLDLFFERRRTPHPHNHPFQRASQEMPQRVEPQRHPRLEHRASQTIIDLTDDNDDDGVVLQRARPRAAALRPPQLGRSDAVSLGHFIDLTAVDDDDVLITGERQLPAPRPALARPAPQPAVRPPSPDLFMPRIPGGEGIHRVFTAAPANGGAARDFFATLRVVGRNMPFLDQVNFFAHAAADVQQAMPGAMDYAHGAFENRKPDHIAPSPARENFTRSPAEDDTIICPSCEQELIHNKEVEEPVVKKNGKAPSRKEREEHPFWVVKECGHVYCNSCYQFRGHSKAGISFRPSSRGTSKSKDILCAVEDCNVHVKSKDKWVGVFL